MPALQAWSTALTAAQNAVTGYAAALTSAQQQLAHQAASSSTGGKGSASGSATSATASGTSTGGSSAAKSGTAGSTGSAATSGSAGSTSSGSLTTSSSSAFGSGSASADQKTAASEAAQEAKTLSDQASITAAEQAVTEAQTNIDASTLTAPIGGVVGAIGINAGQAETSSSGITIVGGGAATVTVPVPLAKLPLIKVGETATANPPGLGVLKGSVSQISLLPTATTGNASSIVTYDVTVTLPDTPTTLATGSYAATTITTAQVANVLTVPVSAVPGVTSGATRVTLLKDGVATPASVTVGAVGGGRAEIRNGLASGDQVVIADLTSALPTNSSTNVRRLTGGNGAPIGGTRTGGAGTGGPGSAPGR